MDTDIHGCSIRKWVVLFLCCAGNVLAAPEDVKISTNRTPVFSTSRLFYVTGGSSVENLQVATFSEKVVGALQDELGRMVPRFPAPVKIVLAEASRTAGVERNQNYADRNLNQEIRINGAEEADQELILEAMVWCILNRYTVAEQTEVERRSALAEVPQWFSMGVGQSLFPLTRNRNRHQLLQTFQVAGFTPSETILSWEVLPAPRAQIFAECGWQVMWMKSQVPGVLLQICEWIGAGEDVITKWREGNPALLEERPRAMRRDAWLVSQIWPTIHVRPYDVKDIRSLDALLNLELPVFDLFVDPVPAESIGIPGLIQNLTESSHRETLKVLKRELRRLNAGKSGDVGEWTESFISYLNEILDEDEKPVESKISDWIARWKRFESKRKQIIAKWSREDRYLDAVEQGL